MERKYAYRLFSEQGGINWLVSGTLSVSYELMSGGNFPVINATFPDYDQANALLEGFAAGVLPHYEFGLEIILVGIRSLCSISNLVMVNAQLTESANGATVTGRLMPRAVTFATAYPAVFVREQYNMTVRQMLEAIRSDYNSRYPAAPLGQLVFDSGVDPICLIPPRLTNMTYFDMLQTVAERHGFQFLIDLQGRIRVFVPTRLTNFTWLVGKHSLISGQLSLDPLQQLGTE